MASSDLATATDTARAAMIEAHVASLRSNAEAGQDAADLRALAEAMQAERVATIEAVTGMRWGADPTYEVRSEHSGWLIEGKVT